MAILLSEDEISRNYCVFQFQRAALVYFCVYGYVFVVVFVYVRVSLLMCVCIYLHMPLFCDHDHGCGTTHVSVCMHYVKQQHSISTAVSGPEYRLAKVNPVSRCLSPSISLLGTHDAYYVQCCCCSQYFQHF